MAVGGPGGFLAQRMLAGPRIEGGHMLRLAGVKEVVRTWYLTAMAPEFLARGTPLAVLILVILVQVGRITCHKTGAFAGIIRKERPLLGAINGWRRATRQERPWPSAIWPKPAPPVT